MRRIVSLTIFALFFCCGGAPAAAQSPAVGGRRADSASVFRQLLDSPAPPPREPGAQDAAAKKERPENFYDDAKPPPDDAPDEDLFDYWQRSIYSSPGGSGPKPSDAVRRRLLASCEAEPKLLAGLLPVLPDDEAGAERVKKLYDAAQGSESFDDGWRMPVREWLRFNSTYFLDDLVALARKAKDKEGYVDNEEALRAYAKVAREGAQVLLQTLASEGQPRTATLATGQPPRNKPAGRTKPVDDPLGELRRPGAW